MTSVFQVEGNTASHGSGLTGVYYCDKTGMPVLHSGYPTPPSSISGADGGDDEVVPRNPTITVEGWMEFWDYAGGASFRAFVAQDGDERTLFAFFDAGLVSRDLKKA
jgi:hypothetical protein